MKTAASSLLICLGLLTAAQGSGISSNQKGAEIDGIFAPWDRPDTPGAAVVVMKDGRIVHKKAYGMADLEWGVPNTPQTVFCVGSVSKQFTAYAVALLAARGRIRLDEDYRAYIPEMPGYGEKITVADLVHHTSGLRDDQMLLYLGDWERGELHGARAVIDRILARQKGLLFPPGRAFDYSNSNYCLLGEIVHRTSGMSLREFARDAIFAPLGMTRTFFLDDFREIVKNRARSYVRGEAGGYRAYIDTHDQVGAGGVHTTVEDMALWDSHFEAPAAAGGRDVRDLVLSPGRLRDGSEIPYAFGLEVDSFRGLRVVRHDGSYGGYNAMFLRFPDERFSVFCAANAGDLDARAACYRIARLFLEDRMAGPARDDRPVIRLEEGALEGLDGNYRDPATMDLLTVTVSGDSLVAALDEGPGVEYAPVAPREFRSTAPGRTDTLEFTGPDGAAAGVRVRRSGRPAAAYERIERASPAARELAAYAGEYFSGELDVVYRFEVSDGRLYVRFKRAPASPLTPLVRDQFAAWPLVFDFERSSGGEVSGFRLGRIGPDGIPFIRIDRGRTGR